MTAAAQEGAVPAARVEYHHIDYIPKAERHGKVRDQFTLWFLANAELATLAVGFLGVSLGLSLGWTLVAIILVGIWWFGFGPNSGGTPPSNTTDPLRTVAWLYRRSPCVSRTTLANNVAWPRGNRRQNPKRKAPSNASDAA